MISKHKKEKNDLIYYSLDDGIHGNMGYCHLFGRLIECIPLNPRNSKKYRSIIGGQTCDSHDIVCDFQLEELAYKQMMADKNENEDEEELEKKRKEMEENELQCALKMSLAAEEEKKKLEELEDEELQKAIQLSLKEQQAKEEPSLLAQMQPSNTQSQQTKKEKKKEEPKKMEDLPKETEKKLNPVEKVANKYKLLLEHDKKVKNLESQKLPNFNAGDENLNKKLNEFEQNKAKKLQEYREMILKMKKEKRQKEENEVDDILKVGGTGAEGQKLTEEEQKKLNLRKQLADKLKAKLKTK